MEDTSNELASFLARILEETGLSLHVSVNKSSNGLVLNIDGPDAELLQTEGGELLDALQHLLNQGFSRSLAEGQRLICDVNGFRATREAELRAMAKHAAGQVRSSGVAFTFGPMNAAERRIIHLALADSDDLYTESLGEGIERKLKVGLK